jgi:hypothetical protein
LTVKAITTPAIITRFSSRVDKSLSFSGCTPELTSAEKAAFMDLQGLNVKLLIQPTDNAPDGMTDVKGQFAEKSPAHRLHSVLFVWWKQETENHKCEVSFESFYKLEMDKLIQAVKERLEPAAF